MRIGVLALQGAFIEHELCLQRMNVDCFEIRQKRDLNASLDGLILPGGESTVMKNLLHALDLFEPLCGYIRSGMPVFGTCAGLILLASRLTGGEPGCFMSMDVQVKRNAYGRQIDSFEAHAGFAGIRTIPMRFIRAPYIERVWGEAQALAQLDGHIVAARQGNQLATAFHPELTDDHTVHAYFLDMVRQAL